MIFIDPMRSFFDGRSLFSLGLALLVGVIGAAKFTHDATDSTTIAAVELRVWDGAGEFVDR